jgi:phage-related protein
VHGKAIEWMGGSPMQTVGPGAREIRIRTWSGGRLEHRIVYVAKFPEAVYVLHAFQKRALETTSQDLETARERYREMFARRAKES